MLLPVTQCYLCLALPIQGQTREEVASPARTALGNDAIIRTPPTTALKPLLDYIGLNVIASGGVKAVKDNLGQYDFDLVNRLDTSTIRQTFLLRNQSNFPLANLHLRLAHPGRLIVLMARQDGSGHAPQLVAQNGVLPTLQPQQELILYVTLDLAAVPPGDVHESIEITAPDHTRPVVRLALTGSVLPVVTFSPSLLDFGPVPATQTRSLNLTVSIDPRLAPSGSVPTLYYTPMLITPVVRNRLAHLNRALELPLYSDMSCTSPA